MRKTICAALLLLTICILPLQPARAEAAKTTGNPLSGWQKMQGGWYYYGAITERRDANAPYKDAWLEDGDDNAERWYYLGSDGMAKCSGWAQIDGRWYYFNSNSQMRTGWLRQNSRTGKPVWYYLHNRGESGMTGSMATGWQRLPNGKSSDTSWYYFNSSGIMRSGWTKSEGSWYYMKADGCMATGWIFVDGNWYYARAASDKPAPGKLGAILQGGSWEIDGKQYRFDNTGVLLSA